MKKSIFSAGLMFLGALLLVVGLLMTGPNAYSGSRVQDDSSPTPVAPASSPPPAAPSSSPILRPSLPPVDPNAQPGTQPSGATLVDAAGAIVALLMGDSGGVGLSAPDSSGDITLRVRPSTSPVPANVTLSTTLSGSSDWVKMTQGGVYFPVYVGPDSAGSSPVATVKVPASTMVGFCSGGYYDKGTGKCSNGSFPTKMVPAGSLSDPAAQTPNVVCRAPMVPTYNPAMKKWLCIVPAGFKNTLGE